MEGGTLRGQQIKWGWNGEDEAGVVGAGARRRRDDGGKGGNYIKEGTRGRCVCVCVCRGGGSACWCSHLSAWKSKRVIHYHLLRLAEVDVFHVFTPRLAFLDVHDADQRHGPAPKQQDGEEHDDDGGGADQLPLLDGLQAQMEAQGVGDSTTQTWWRRRGEEIIKRSWPTVKWCHQANWISLDPLTTKPHDEHHFRCDLVISEEIQQEGQREDVHRSSQKNQNLRTETRSWGGCFRDQVAFLE